MIAQLTRLGKTGAVPSTLRITNVKEISAFQKGQVVENFNESGAVIIETEACDNPQKNLIALTDLFGEIIHHNHSNSQGVVEVKLEVNKPKYVNKTNDNLSLHTDATFETIAVPIMALQCVIQSETGGLSKLVYSKDVYEYIARKHPCQLPLLFDPDVLTVTRDNQRASKPIFTNNQQGRLQMAWRSDKAADITVKPNAIKVFEQIKNFVEDPNHQVIFPLKPHQILVLDNTRVLHGRTGFAPQDSRLLNRLWLNGNNPDLKLGFVV